MSSPPAVPSTERFADLSGRRAVVTGSASGIGREIALELARAGSDLVIHSRSSKSEAHAVRDECRRLGRRAELVIQDFSSACPWDEFVDRAWHFLGGIDVWVN